MIGLMITRFLSANEYGEDREGIGSRAVHDPARYAVWDHYIQPMFIRVEAFVGHLDGLVSDARSTTRDQVACLLCIGREVQVGEEHLAGAHAVVLLRDRLLHLQDEVGLGPHVIRGAEDLGAGRDEVLVGQ